MYKGYLLKAGGVAIPNRYIRPQSYSVTPCRRLELSAERDMAGVLHRDTAAHTPSRVEFETPPLANGELGALNGLLAAAFTDGGARRLTLEYYVPEIDGYRAGAFYLEDTEYRIRHIGGARVAYEPVRYAFNEY